MGYHNKRRVILGLSILSALVSSIYLITSLMGIDILLYLPINVNIINPLNLPNFPTNLISSYRYIIVVVFTMGITLLFLTILSSMISRKTDVNKVTAIDDKVMNEIKSISLQLETLNEKMDLLLKTIEELTIKNVNSDVMGMADKKSIEENVNEVGGIAELGTDDVNKDTGTDKSIFMDEDEKLLDDLKDMVDKLITINRLLRSFVNKGV